MSTPDVSRLTLKLQRNILCLVSYGKQIFAVLVLGVKSGYDNTILQQVNVKNAHPVSSTLF